MTNFMLISEKIINKKLTLADLLFMIIYYYNIYKKV